MRHGIPLYPYKDHLLLVSGNFCENGIWMYMAAVLSCHGYKVHFPGGLFAGEGDIGKAGFADYQGEVRRTAIEIRESCGKRPVIIGHGLGGTYALGAAAESLAEAVVLLAPLAPGNFKQSIFSEAIATLLTPWLTISLFKQTHSWPYLPPLGAVKNIAEATSEWDVGHLYSQLRPGSGNLLWELLTNADAAWVNFMNVRCPVLAFAGARDRLASPSLVRKISSSCGGQFQAVENADYFFICDTRTLMEVAADVDRFLIEASGLRIAS